MNSRAILYLFSLILFFIIFPFYYLSFPLEFPSILKNLQYLLGDFKIFPPFRFLPILDLLGLLWLGSFLVGRRVLKSLQCWSDVPWENRINSLLVGFGTISLLLFFLGVIQLWTPWIMTMAFLLLILLSIRIGELKEDYSFLKSLYIKGKCGNFSKLDITFFLFIFSIIFLSMCCSLVPPDQSDGLRYHLAGPELFLKNGGFYFIPHNAFTNFPFSIEMFYGLALAWGRPELANLIHWSFFVILTFLIFNFCKREYGNIEAKWATLFVVTIPFLPLLSSWAFIEVGLAVFQLSAIIYFSKWWISKCEKDKKKNLILVGVFTGISLGIKYTSGLFVLIFVPLIILKLLNEKGSIPKSALQFGLPALILAGPWYIKSWVLTGNPLYPFAGSVFPTTDWGIFNSEFFSFHSGLKGGLSELSNSSFLGILKDFFTLPFRATTDQTGFGFWQIGPLPLILLPLVFVKKEGDKIRKILLLFLPVMYLFWAYTYRDNRFLILVLILEAILIAPSIGQIFKNKRKWAVPIGVLLIGVMFYNIVWIGNVILSKHNPFYYIFGNESREEYLERRISQYSAYQLMDTLPEDSKIFYIGEYRGFYSPRKYISSDFFDTPAIVSAIKKAGTLEYLYNEFSNLGVTHIYYNKGELDQYFSFFDSFFQEPQYNSPSRKIFRELLQDQNHLNLIWQKDSQFIFEMK